MMETSDVNDRTEHEIYAHPFLRSVMAGVSSIMCSYSMSFSPFARNCYASGFYLIPITDMINGTYACENDKTLNDLLKREFGFQGCK